MREIFTFNLTAVISQAKHFQEPERKKLIQAFHPHLIPGDFGTLIHKAAQRFYLTDYPVKEITHGPS